MQFSGKNCQNNPSMVGTTPPPPSPPHRWETLNLLCCGNCLKNTYKSRTQCIYLCFSCVYKYNKLQLIFARCQQLLKNFILLTFPIFLRFPLLPFEQVLQHEFGLFSCCVREFRVFCVTTISYSIDVFIPFNAKVLIHLKLTVLFHYMS